MRDDRLERRHRNFFADHQSSVAACNPVDLNKLLATRIPKGRQDFRRRGLFASDLHKTPNGDTEP